ncbi:protein CYCLOPS-like isoform X2 [Impatiens glandulifera]|uniref:protein CYCLOPS-like isoform X2 n=1 Tax=Impatiens glandulifera TaxID=253017 RepID=UPI001FB0C5CD|nr:protein CYCLOPS-like isoform X2 [Impatiens glandulifera]
MEMEGRSYSELYRNTSEDMFFKSLMETVPSMEILGFKNLSQSFRTDSEELFKNWLTDGENHGYNPTTSIAHRTRQASKRISTDLATLSQEPLSIIEKKRNNDSNNNNNNNNAVLQNIPAADGTMSEFNQQLTRNTVEKDLLQPNNLHLAKAWFHSSQPMTRSRSSELRKRYAAMQISQSSLGLEATNNTMSRYSMNSSKQEFANPEGLAEAQTPNIPNQFNMFISMSNSSSSAFNNPPIDEEDEEEPDKISSVVSMLKGTIERKKLNNSSGFNETGLNEGRETEFQGALRTFEVENDFGTSQTCLDDGFIMTHTNPIMCVMSGEPSQSESSVAAPLVSNGFDAYDGPSNCGQTLSFSKANKKPIVDQCKRIYDNIKDDKKKGSLIRHGSVTSTYSVDKSDPTKKRRVERSRKMAEAKERNLTPSLPSDMQSILKRCENLEKEVRSLKLNLSFMNRKDSEQTKHIEELQKQNDELTDEKERLLEEIERIISETGNI